MYDTIIHRLEKYLQGIKHEFVDNVIYIPCQTTPTIIFADLDEHLKHESLASVRRIIAVSQTEVAAFISERSETGWRSFYIFGNIGLIVDIPELNGLSIPLSKVYQSAAPWAIE